MRTHWLPEFHSPFHEQVTKQTREHFTCSIYSPRRVAPGPGHLTGRALPIVWCWVHLMGCGPTPLWGWSWATTIFREHHTFALNCASCSFPPLVKYFSHPYKNLTTQNSLILQYNNLQDISCFSRNINYPLITQQNPAVWHYQSIFISKIICRLKFLLGALPAVMYLFFPSINSAFWIQCVCTS